MRKSIHMQVHSQQVGVVNNTATEGQQPALVVDPDATQPLSKPIMSRCLGWTAMGMQGLRGRRHTLYPASRGKHTQYCVQGCAAATAGSVCAAVQYEGAAPAATTLRQVHPWCQLSRPDVVVFFESCLE